MSTHNIGWRKLSFNYHKMSLVVRIYAVTAQLIRAFVFATQIVQSLSFLNQKFQASSHLVWLYSPVCVGPGRKPQRLVFSEQGSNIVRYASYLFFWITPVFTGTGTLYHALCGISRQSVHPLIQVFFPIFESGFDQFGFEQKSGCFECIFHSVAWPSWKNKCVHSLYSCQSAWTSLAGF